MTDVKSYYASIDHLMLLDWACRFNLANSGENFHLVEGRNRPALFARGRHNDSVHLCAPNGLWRVTSRYGLFPACFRLRRNGLLSRHCGG
jgi:hypothetical protein